MILEQGSDDKGTKNILDILHVKSSIGMLLEITRWLYSCYKYVWQWGEKALMMI